MSVLTLNSTVGINATEKAIRLARKHVGNGAAMESSARLCLADAIDRMNTGNYDSAHFHACKSLKYSVGIFHADYKSAASDRFSVDSVSVNC